MALNFTNEEKLDMLETYFVPHRSFTAAVEIYENYFSELHHPKLQNYSKFMHTEMI